MKLSKIFLLFGAMALTALLFTACVEEDDDNPVNGDDPEPPAAPSDIQATVLDSETIKLRWNASPDENSTNFANYLLTISPGQFQPVTIPAGQTTHTVDGLTEGTVYTFSLVSEGTEDTNSTATEVTWSPASRFVDTPLDEPIRLYGKGSNVGSGLAIYDQAEGGPMVYAVSSSNKWNLAFQNESATELYFGTAGQGVIEYNWGAGDPSNPAELGDFLIGGNNLDEVYDSQALDVGIDYSYFKVNLASDQFQNVEGAILFARYMAGSNNQYNYAKILVKKINGSYVQVDDVTGDEYIEIEMSYQMEPGVPYAGIEK